MPSEIIDAWAEVHAKNCEAGQAFLRYYTALCDNNVSQVEVERLRMDWEQAEVVRRNRHVMAIAKAVNG